MQLFLIFELHDQTFGTPVRDVTEINQMVDITPVPKLPPFVKGVVNLRGKVIPIIDLRLKFGITASAFSKKTSIIVIDVPGGPMGVIVDAVHSVFQIADEEIETPPPFDDKVAERSCIGIGKGLGKDHVKSSGSADDNVIVLVDLTVALSKDVFETVDLNRTHGRDVNDQGHLAVA